MMQWPWQGQIAAIMTSSDFTVNITLRKIDRPTPCDANAPHAQQPTRNPTSTRHIIHKISRCLSSNRYPCVVSSSLSPIPTNDCGGSTFREKFGYPHPQAPDPPILTLAPRRPHVRSAGFVKSAVYVRGRAFNSFREHD